MTSTLIDPRLYRDVIGRFATGVTVLTFKTPEVMRGMTANAIASVSLEPTLLLACVEKQSSVHEQLRRAETFALNILADDQLVVSRTFAQRGLAGMGGVPYRLGATGAPIIDGVLAWFECAVHERLDGGDHTIYLGRVLDLAIERPDARPLLYFGSAYRAIGERLQS